MTKKLFLLLSFLLLVLMACSAPSAEESETTDGAIAIDVYRAPT